MRKCWFTDGAELDSDIRRRFGAAVALVLLLDQFPRNIFRGKAKAFTGDERAQRLVSSGLARGAD